MVNVLPVPALASRTVTPGPGSGPQGSNGAGWRWSSSLLHLLVVEKAVPQPAGQAAEAADLRCRPSGAAFVVARRLPQQLVEGQFPPEDQQVLGLARPRGELVRDFQAPVDASTGSPP